MIFISVLLLRTLANFNLFNYSLAVIYPLVFIVVFSISNITSLVDINLRSVSKEYFLVFLVIFLVLLSTLLQVVIFDNLTDSSNRTSHDFILSTSILGICWLLAGNLFAKKEKFSPVYNVIVIISFFLVVLMLISSIDAGIGVDYYYLTKIRSDDIRIQHLIVTEPITYMLFLFLAIGFNTKFRIFFLLCFLMTFISLGGRTALYCAVLTLLIYSFITSNIALFSFRLFLYLITAAIVLYLIGFDDDMLFNRLLFSGSIESDESFQLRQEFLIDFIDGALGQIPIGNPNFLIYRHNSLGTYSHNILSVFQLYGLLVFLIILYCFYYIIRHIYTYRLYKSKNVVDIFGVTLLIFVLLSVVFGKAIVYTPLWFVIGFWLYRLYYYRMKY